METGHGLAGLRRSVWDAEILGSNPSAPKTYFCGGNSAVEYLTSNEVVAGSNPVLRSIKKLSCDMEIQLFDDAIEQFIRSLEKPIIAKTLRVIDLLEGFGSKLGMPHSKKVEKNLFELRVCSIQEIRIFYTFHKNFVVLLHGFIKKSQRIPKRELNVALRKLKALD